MSIGRVPGATGIQPSIVDAKGDLIVATAADSVDRLAVGTNGQYLKADSTAATGLSWATLSASGKVLQVVSATTSTAASNTTTTYADTNLTVTITPSATTSKVLIIFTQNDCGVSNGGLYGLWIKLLRGSTDLIQYPSNFWTNTANYFTGQVNGVYLDSPSSTSALTYKTQFRNKIAGSYVAVQDNGAYASSIIAIEIGA